MTFAEMTFAELHEKLAREIEANGGPGNLAGYQFGAAWNAGELFPRAAVARILDEYGFPGPVRVLIPLSRARTAPGKSPGGIRRRELRRPRWPARRSQHESRKAE